MGTGAPPARSTTAFWEHAALKQLGVEHEWQPRGIQEGRTIHHLEVQMRRVAVPGVAKPADQLSRRQRRALADAGRDRAGLQMAVGHIAPAADVLDDTVPAGGRGGHVVDRPHRLLVRHTVHDLDLYATGLLLVITAKVVKSDLPVAA